MTITNTTVDDICDALIAIGATVTGVTSAIDPPPANPTTAVLPLLYVFTGPATVLEDEHGETWDTLVRQFRLQVAVIPTGQGDPNTRETLVRPLIDAAVDKFRSYPQLNGLKFVERLRVVSDSGVAILPEYGGKFIGFEVRLEVQYIQRRALAARE